MENIGARKSWRNILPLYIYPLWLHEGISFKGSSNWQKLGIELLIHWPVNDHCLFIVCFNVASSLGDWLSGSWWLVILVWFTLRSSHQSISITRVCGISSEVCSHQTWRNHFWASHIPVMVKHSGWFCRSITIVVIGVGFAEFLEENLVGVVWLALAIWPVLWFARLVCLVVDEVAWGLLQDFVDVGIIIGIFHFLLSVITTLPLHFYYANS